MVLTDNFEGKPYNRPNDLVVDKNGGVYFTDFAFQPSGGMPAAIYYIPPGGKVMRVAENPRPNGVQLSPDEKTLYVNTNGEYLLAFDVQADGTLGPARNFGKYQGIASGQTPRGDGLAVDSEGRVYATTTAGVLVFDPKGQYLGTMVLSRVPQNLGLRRSGQEDPVHCRPWCRLQGADDGTGIQGAPQVNRVQPYGARLPP